MLVFLWFTLFTAWERLLISYFSLVPYFLFVLRPPPNLENLSFFFFILLCFLFSASYFVRRIIVAIIVLVTTNNRPSRFLFVSRDSVRCISQQISLGFVADIIFSSHTACGLYSLLPATIHLVT